MNPRSRSKEKAYKASNLTRFGVKFGLKRESGESVLP